jgi:2-iminobutanoate/2-iminopropanoate deaminase
MISTQVSRRNFATGFAAFLSAVGITGALGKPTPAAAHKNSVQKLDYDGKPAGKGFITPVIVYDGVIYIAGQGAHSHDSGDIPMDIEAHAKKVMENVKTLVETGGGTMDSILQLTVFLTTIDNYDGLNKVFKTYFPNGGPARTCVAVAALPGNSLVEINCTAAVVRK